MTENPAEILLRHFRAVNPQSRIRSIVHLIRNTGSVKQYGCAWCGAEGPTFSGAHRETKRSTVWRAAHLTTHTSNVAAELVAFDAKIDKASATGSKVVEVVQLCQLCGGDKIGDPTTRHVICGCRNACRFCDVLGADHSAPDTNHDAAWLALAKQHANGCTWIATRGGTL